MSFFSRLFKRKEIEYELLEEEPNSESDVAPKREGLNFHRMVERQDFVHSCLDQMKNASYEIERLQNEYKVVNAYLTDMEEIDAMAAEQHIALEEHAKAISYLEVNRSDLQKRKSFLPETEFRRMQRLEGEAPDAIRSLRNTEEYHEKIKKDLRRLEGEKQACLFRMTEARTGLLNYRGMTVICVLAACACVLLMFILQFALELDATVGYLLTAVAAACLLTYFFVKYKEAASDLRVASNSYNRLITLQNTVKIRYVNNANLLDYYFLKFHTSGADKLEEQYEKYLEEKEERKRLEQTEMDMEFHCKQLVKQLREYHLYDPVIWVHQTEAILNPKEMVEVRHSLILRRQALRKQMDYNKEIAETAKAEITDLAKDYPMYAKEILSMVSAYEAEQEKYNDYKGDEE
ncbi:MAG: hypothetical protein K6G07_01420 [Lachnospiraceae bacterium]|nr:hypothetical protein [Lachnospiraceae bacterium]